MRLVRQLKQLFWGVFFPVWGSACLWFAITGLHSGVVPCVPGKTTPCEGSFSRVGQPGSFWVSVGLWFFSAFITLLLSLGTTLPALRSLWQKTPAVQARKRAARAQDAEDQLRDVEAGQGPAPLWVRFPGAAELIPEAALQAYLKDVFVPFWKSLGAESRAAYLQRNPPTNAYWQQTMAELSTQD